MIGAGPRIGLAAAALAVLACAPRSEPAALSPARPAGGMHEIEPVARAWPVMGTMLQITVWAGDSARAVNALTAGRAAVQRVDSLMSNYRPESELSAVNRRAGTDSVTVLSRETAEVLEAALRFARASGGALDVTVGPVVDVWGFYRERGALPSTVALDSARALVGYARVEYDSIARTVRLPLHGMRLDFGAIAKGYAVDRAAAEIRATGVERAMIDLGGNLRMFGPAPDDDGWRVGLRDPRSPEESIAVVRIDRGAVATSGDYERFFMHHGVRYSHIIDPVTGWPARGVAGVSVIAPDGLRSDALSTALFVLGPDRGCALARQAGVEALWVLDGGGRDGAVVMTPGLQTRVSLSPRPDRQQRNLHPYRLCERKDDGTRHIDRPQHIGAGWKAGVPIGIDRVPDRRVGGGGFDQGRAHAAPAKLL